MSRKFSSQNRVFDTDHPSPGAHSGFKGDSLNPKIVTSVFQMPKPRLKKSLRRSNKVR